MLVLCFLRPELVFLRLRSDKQTNKQTQNDYHNPSAHARRGNQRNVQTISLKLRPVVVVLLEETY